MNTEKLRRLMDSKGINQCQLADATGTSQAFISYMMRGYKTPSVEVLKRIADYFGVTVDCLLE